MRLYYVLFLANEDDIWFYMADSLNWCSIEIYAGNPSEILPMPMLEADRHKPSFVVQRQHSKHFSRHTYPASGVAMEVEDLPTIRGTITKTITVGKW